MIQLSSYWKTKRKKQQGNVLLAKRNVNTIFIIMKYFYFGSDVKLISFCAFLKPKLPGRMINEYNKYCYNTVTIKP